MSACASYRPGEGICRDGFPQLAFCAGHAACATCGEPTKHVPLCLTDKAPPHLFDDAGRTRLARNRANCAGAAKSLSAESGGDT